MYFHLSINQQLQRIFKDLNLNDNRMPTSKTCFKDISDGRIYKKVIREEQKYCENVFTFSISTDGVSLCEKSSLGIWPIYLVLNEIPLNQRFCLENVVVAGKIHSL